MNVEKKSCSTNKAMPCTQQFNFERRRKTVTKKKIKKKLKKNKVQAFVQKKKKVECHVTLRWVAVCKNKQSKQSGRWKKRGEGELGEVQVQRSCIIKKYRATSSFSGWLSRKDIKWKHLYYSRDLALFPRKYNIGGWEGAPTLHVFSCIKGIFSPFQRARFYDAGVEGWACSLSYLTFLLPFLLQRVASFMFVSHSFFPTHCLQSQLVFIMPLCAFFSVFILLLYARIHTLKCQV